MIAVSGSSAVAADSGGLETTAEAENGTGSGHPGPCGSPNFNSYLALAADAVAGRR
jgi:hypothetical protein